MNTNADWISALLRDAERLVRRQPGLRLGQAAFNLLVQRRPALAERVRGTLADPFYLDMRLRTFEAFLRQQDQEVST